MINAFHPQYIKTFYPQMMASIKLNSDQVSQGKINGAKSRITREAAHGKSVDTINKKDVK